MSGGPSTKSTPPRNHNHWGSFDHATNTWLFVPFLLAAPRQLDPTVVFTTMGCPATGYHRLATSGATAAESTPWNSQEDPIGISNQRLPSQTARRPKNASAGGRWVQGLFCLFRPLSDLVMGRAPSSGNGSLQGPASSVRKPLQADSAHSLWVLKSGSSQFLWINCEVRQPFRSAQLGTLGSKLKWRDEKNARNC